MRRYIYLAGAVSCILFLYLLSVISHPYEIDISELDEYEGEEVAVDGIVTDKECGDNHEILTIRNGNHSANIFLYGSSSTDYGDRIRATGIVERYEGRMEIRAKSVSIVEKWNGGSMPLWELSENFMDYIGTNVNVTGYIDGIHKRYFYLTNSERQYRIRVFYDENFTIQVEDHQHVYVRGMFRYDGEKMCMYMEMSEKYHGVEVID